MSKCKNCGKELSDEWKACPFCGTAVEDERKRSRQKAVAAERAATEAKRRAEEAAAPKKRAGQEAAAKNTTKEQTIKLLREDRYIEAFPDILRFAEEGDVEFCFKAGYCYSHGKGVAKDDDKAKYWWGKAAAQGDKSAEMCLKLFFLPKAEAKKRTE